MSKRIALVAATEKEIEPLVAHLQTNAIQHALKTFELEGVYLDIIYTGIGMMETTYMLMEYLTHRHPDGWIQMGIGGALDRSLSIGQVYQIKSEMISGSGAELQSGAISSPFEMGWLNPNALPYTNGILECPYTILSQQATGMTSLYAHGHEGSIELLHEQPHGQIENMEGASFFYVSLLQKIPFLSIRSISNHVEPRNTVAWNIPLAVHELNAQVLDILLSNHMNPELLFRSEVS